MVFVFCTVPLALVHSTGGMASPSRLWVFWGSRSALLVLRLGVALLAGVVASRW